MSQEDWESWVIQSEGTDKQSNDAAEKGVRWLGIFHLTVYVDGGNPITDNVSKAKYRAIYIF